MIKISEEDARKIIARIYGINWIRSYLIMELERIAEDPSVPNGSSMFKQKAQEMYQAIMDGEFACTKWERDFITDNRNEDHPSEKVEMHLEKIWRRFKT